MLTDDARVRTVAALRALQGPGGFRESPGAPVSLSATLSVVKSLQLLGVAVPRPDAVCADVLAELDRDQGAFRSPAGEPSVLATAAGLLTLRALDATRVLADLLVPAFTWMTTHATAREDHFMTIAVADECELPVAPARSVAYFTDLDVGGASVLADGIACSALLRAGHVPVEIDARTQRMLAAQTPDGGIADTGPDGSPDLWTTYCVLRALDLRHASPRRSAMANWVLRGLLVDGGFGAGGTLSAGATYQSLSVLDWLVTPVLDAARAGDAAEVRRLLDGANPDVRDLRGWTPLMAAAVRGRASTVEALLGGDGGPSADPDLRQPDADALPVFWAGQSGDVACVRALLARRPGHAFARSSVNGHTVLLQAAFFGSEQHRDLADWLLRDAGTLPGLAPEDTVGADLVRRRLMSACNVRGYTARTMSELWGNTAMAALFASYDRTTPDERERYRTELLASIARPAPDDPAEAAAQALTDQCVALIDDGLARVAAAADADAPAAVDTLVSGLRAHLGAPGLEINRLGGPLSEPPLVVAATGVDSTPHVARARQLVVACLLEHGADPDLPELHPMGVDAVIRAAVLNHFAVLRQLGDAMPPLAFAAALNERPAINGQTALHDTVHRALTAPPGTLDSHLEQLRWAVAHGARTDIEDLTGTTVVDRARLALDDTVLAEHAPAVLAALGVDTAPVTRAWAPGVGASPVTAPHTDASPVGASPVIAPHPRGTTMTDGQHGSTSGRPHRALTGRRIAVLMEKDFYEQEIFYYQQRFAEEGADLHLLTRLWGQDRITFHGHEFQAPIDVDESLENLSDDALRGFDAIIVPSGFVADRLRYTDDVAVLPPATDLMRRAFAEPTILKGIICHGMWLMAPTPELIRGRHVTAHNNLHGDVLNMGGIYVDADVVEDGDLITGRTGAQAAEFARAIIDRLSTARPVAVPA